MKAGFIGAGKSASHWAKYLAEGGNNRTGILTAALPFSQRGGSLYGTRIMINWLISLKDSDYPVCSGSCEPSEKFGKVYAILR